MGNRRCFRDPARHEVQTMSKLVGEQSVVIGAGMGGLTAAAVLSEFFSKVIVLERDELPSKAVPRAGVPQGRHVHALLGGGLNALNELFPGFEDELAAAGAVPIQVGLETRLERPGYDPFPLRDLGWRIFSMTRPLLEHAVRRRIARRGNIEIRSHCLAREIVPTSDGTAVKAVRCSSGDSESAAETIAADLVVDASGRGATTLAFLESSGQSLPPATSIEVDMRYSTVCFKVPENAPNDWKSIAYLPDPRVTSRGAIMFPIEGECWLVSFAAAHGDAPPADLDGCLAFARQLRMPTLYDAIRNAEPVGEIERFGFPGSVRRHFERLEKFPRGLLPIADAVCRFNPVFGQGMSVAAQQACLLRHLLRNLTETSNSLDDLPRVFFSKLEAIIEAPWATANLDFVYPQTRGERPRDFELTLKFLAAMNRLAAREPEIHKVVIEVNHLIRPRSVFREPAFAQRVMAEMQAS
jgi:2-polyprenyl-6-methoxyphenol hydroxylase-like FAD-dependent oxidoreductase